MPRKLRFVPEGGSLVEITCRVIGGEFLLEPCPAVNELIIGIIGRAQRLHDMEICSLVFLTSHYHLLVRAKDAGQLADFMGFVNSNISKEMNARLGRRGPFWGRRYDAILVSDEGAAQLARLRYQLSHGVKENLVEDPRHWPGVSSARALLEDGKLSGYWFDRSKENAAKRRGKKLEKLTYATRETVYLSPLPFLRQQGLSESAMKDLLEGMIEEIIEQGRRARSATGSQHDAAAHGRYSGTGSKTQRRRPKRSPAPRFHAWERQERERLIRAYQTFASAYYRASTAFSSGDRSVLFPKLCFPPRLPFYRGVQAQANS